MTTQYDWAAEVLAFADLPQTQVNLDNFVRWMAAEEPPSEWWNNWDPLNANNILAGDAEEFPDLTTAAQATAAILEQSNMAGIYAVLQWSGGLWAFSAAVVAAPWSADHYGGNPAYFTGVPLPAPVEIPGSGPSGPPPVIAPPGPGTIVFVPPKPTTVAVMNLPGSEKGYWLVDSDGGVFTFGAATFHGSLGGQTISAPIVGGAPTSDGKGYRLVGSDGAVYDFGSAVYEGGENT